MNTYVCIGLHKTHGLDLLAACLSISSVTHGCVKIIRNTRPAVLTEYLCPLRSAAGCYGADQAHEVEPVAVGPCRAAPYKERHRRAGRHRYVRHCRVGTTALSGTGGAGARDGVWGIPGSGETVVTRLPDHVITDL